MLQIYYNAVASVTKPPTLLLLIANNQEGIGWCDQFTQEGYNVVHVAYPGLEGNGVADLEQLFRKADKELMWLGEDWAVVSYGLHALDAHNMTVTMGQSLARLKACVHFCPVADEGKNFIIRDMAGKHIPTTFHLPASDECLHASLADYCDASKYDYHLPTSSPTPISIYTYPLVPSSPPFPLLTNAPARITTQNPTPGPPHIRSATSLSLSRSLTLIKRCLGPYFDLEAIWEAHGYYEFVDRNAQKTLSTMVDEPYVNHIATMTGGMGREELLRFYKYHFTGLDVTPPDAEMISVSRTVGSDRVVDEMIFKCTHTTELDYFLPGVPPTGKKLEFPVVGIIAFRGDRLCFEHIYWDQASVLVQLGLVDPSKLPVAGIEVARKVMDPFGMPSNSLMARWKESEGRSMTWSPLNQRRILSNGPGVFDEGNQSN